MKPQDEALFELLIDFSGIERIREIYPKTDKNGKINLCEEVYQQGMDCLKNSTYSNINVQDSHGNTFLHYAIRQGLVNISIALLKKGANPFIENNEEKNAFQYTHSVNNTIVSDIQNPFKNMKIKDFDILAPSLSPDFQRWVFHNLKITDEFSEEQEITGFLKKHNLYNFTNYLHLSFNGLMPVKDKILKGLFAQKRNSDDNSYLLNNFITRHGYSPYYKEHSQDFDAFMKEDFTINSHYFISAFSNESFIAKAKSDSFFQNIQLECLKKIEVYTRENPIPKGLLDLFEEEPELEILYHKTRLENKLPEKAENYKKLKV